MGITASEGFGDLKTALSAAWCPETAWPPMRAEWTAVNPAHAQCLVTALLLRKKYGGDLVMGNVHVPGRAEPVLHFLNRIDGQDTDLTWPQFPDDSRFEELDLSVAEHKALYDECLQDPDTQSRFRLLGYLTAVRLDKGCSQPQ